MSANSTLFTGALVRLVAPDSEKDAEIVAGWTRDSEFNRLFGTGPARARSAAEVRRFITEDEDSDRAFIFHIRALAGDRLIGSVDIEPNWTHGDGWVGIGIGERAYWGKGYGADAMRVLLRYAFTELNLRRVSLTVFEYNPRAIRSYEKCGFVVEGRQRQVLRRDGRRWDLIHMSILHAEWEKSSGQYVTQ